MTDQTKIIAGNVYNKYATRNPIARMMMDGFFKSLDALIDATGATRVHEVGCGEGYLASRLANKGYTVLGTDFSNEIIQTARREFAHESLTFEVASIYDLVPEKHSAPLILCCEVLEHLERPEEALKVLASLQFDTLILSVPREPIWSFLNMARGKYWSDWGNTPGHLQKWSTNAFLRLVGTYFTIETVKTPLPWTQVSCRRKK